ICRNCMAANGFSPATRVFEAAGAGACIITDEWVGIEQFFAPETEILVARDGNEVAGIMERLTPGQARSIGARARERALAQHTYAQRAVQFETAVTEGGVA
ncbi:MAG: glycosyltransferase family 1 protein, partial [Verrucomicrobia bacterium]|nr:glycosyltransferase family 1 protein [Verrucomicrobiota bacterium]